MKLVFTAISTAMVISVAACGGTPTASHGAAPTPSTAVSPSTAPRTPESATLIPPLIHGVHQSGQTAVTIVVNPDGSVDSYIWLTGGAAARAEYITTATGVLEGSWNANGKSAGTFRLSCNAKDDVVSTQKVPGHKNPVSLNVGREPGACVGGRLSALVAAVDQAKANRFSYVVRKS